jgi:hypothetical protein
MAQLAVGDDDRPSATGGCRWQRGYLDRLSRRLLRPPAPRRIGDVVLSAYLVKRDVGYRELLGQMRQWLGPNQLIKFLARECSCQTASVAGLLVTTEAMVAEKPKKEAAPAMPAGAGMDF